MMTWGLLSLVSIALALLGAWTVPRWSADRLLREQSTASSAVPVLGIGWLAWLVALAFISAVFGLALAKLSLLGDLFTWVKQNWIDASGNAPIAAVVSVIPWMPVAGALGLGLVADIYGGAQSARTRWSAALHRDAATAHRLKVFGVWALAFVAAGSTMVQLQQVDPMVSGATGWVRGAWTIAGWLCATVVIGLSARYVERSSVSAGGAAKAYLPLAIVGAGVAAWGLWQTMEAALFQAVVSASISGGQVIGLPTGEQIWYWFAGVVVVLLTVVLGPVLATWRADVSGAARLGSAGALAMGVFAGYLLVRGAPLWLAGVFALVLIALLLMGGETQTHSKDDGTRAGGPVAEGDDAGRDDVS